MAHTKMSKELLMRWANALLSGEYKQTQYVLCRGDSTKGEDEEFCCLGVLWDLAGDTWQEEVDLVEADSVRWSVPGARPSSPAPLPETLVTYTDQRRLSKLNDEGYSFEDIAAYLMGTVDHLMAATLYDNRLGKELQLWKVK